MAFITTHAGHDFGIVKTLRAVAHAVAEGFALYAERNSRSAQIDRLNRLSDAELAEMGLTRDRIVFHVFRDRFYM